MMNCPICGYMNAPGDGICRSCGYTLSLQAAPDYGQQLSPEFQDAEPSLTGFAAPEYTSLQTAPYTDSGALMPEYAAQYPQQGAPASAYPAYSPYYPPPRTGNPARNSSAITGMILGIVSMPALCLTAIVDSFTSVGIASALVALVMSAAALVLSILGVSSQHKGFAIAGIVCSSVGLLLNLFALLGVMS